MIAQPETFSETLGLWLGYTFGPVFGGSSLLRRARIFHPEGMVFHATVKPNANVNSAFYDLAKNLSGSAVVRLSSSLWKQESLLPDALGCSIRFRVGKPPNIHVEDGAQDLILITSPTLVTLPLNVLTTHQHDFLDNVYYGAAPYKIAGHSNCRIRLVPPSVNMDGNNRKEKLLNAIINDVAVFQLEVADSTGTPLWQPLAEVRLNAPLEISQEALTFSPFRAALGIYPQGIINYMRVGPYVYSQFIRSRFSGMMQSEKAAISAQETQIKTPNQEQPRVKTV